MYVYRLCVCLIPTKAKRVSAALELESQWATMWVLATKPWFYGRTASALTVQPSPQNCFSKGVVWEGLVGSSPRIHKAQGSISSTPENHAQWHTLGRQTTSSRSCSRTAWGMWDCLKNFKKLNIPITKPQHTHMDLFCMSHLVWEYKFLSSIAEATKRYCTVVGLSAYQGKVSSTKVGPVWAKIIFMYYHLDGYSVKIQFFTRSYFWKMFTLVVSWQ